MALPASLNATQLTQVRELFAEEFNIAFNELIPKVTANIIDQVRALLDEHIAAGPSPGGVIPVPPVREFVGMQDFATLAEVMVAARKREIELQTPSKRKVESTSSKTSNEAQKKMKFGDEPRYAYKPATRQGDRPSLVCYNYKE